MPTAVAVQAGAFDALGALWYAARGPRTAVSRWPADPRELVQERRRRIGVLPRAQDGPGSVRLLEDTPQDGAAGHGACANDTGDVVVHDEGPVVLGVDLGSTGSKAVLLDVGTGAVRASVYRRTDGNPVEAARALVARLQGMSSAPVWALGLTGSGRDAVAVVARAAYDDALARIVVQNEIVAHARAAAWYDDEGGRSLSIIEIGGQDAKFINVRDGTVVESDMNRVCSAGTGSFLEEQALDMGLDDIAQFGQLAAAGQTPPDLGQTCTVFVSDLAAEALADGYTRADIFAGLQYAIIRNYRSRVMGDRRLLDRVFFQGKPASNVSLARTLAAITGREVLVPPDPGAMGAVGIALLAREALPPAPRHGSGDGRSTQREADPDPAPVPAPFDLERLLSARVVSRRELRCGDKACGNMCRIESAVVEVAGQRRVVRSGGNCPKYEDVSAVGRKLPRGAPNAFHERDELLVRTLQRWGLEGVQAPAPSQPAAEAHPLAGLHVSLPYAHYVMDLAPFFVAYLRTLGARVTVPMADSGTLAVGDRLCGAAGSCAPVKLAHGLAIGSCDVVLMPKIVNVPCPGAGEGRSTCPMAQGAPESVAAAIESGRGAGQGAPQVVHPVLLPQTRDELDSPVLSAALADLAQQLAEVAAALERTELSDAPPAEASVAAAETPAPSQQAQGGRISPAVAQAAVDAARAAQREFDDERRAIGERTLEYAAKHGYPTVVIVGETHVMHDRSLNTGIHDLVAQNGALPLPVDSYPLPPDAPDVPRMHWASGSAALRAALDARRRGTVFPLLLGAFGCGPNSFVEPLFQDLMEGYPHAVFETDGHGGLAGYVTRVQAFLYAAQAYAAKAHDGPGTVAAEHLQHYLRPPEHSLDVRDASRVVFGTVGGTLGTQVAAALRGRGIDADFVGATDGATLRLAQDSCSGKECLPYQLIWGGVARYFSEQPPTADERVLLLSVGNGFRSCRANLFPVTIGLGLERMGLRDKVMVGDLSLLTSDLKIVPAVWSALVAQDILNLLRFHHLAGERTPGDADGLFATWQTALERCLEKPARHARFGKALADGRDVVARVETLVGEAAADYARLPQAAAAEELRDVLVAGDIFLRVDEWGNGGLQRRLADLGLRVTHEPFAEFFELLALRDIQEQRPLTRMWTLRMVTLRVMRSVVRRLVAAGRVTQPWLFWHDIRDVEAASREVFDGFPFGETITTVGSIVHTWRTQPIDGAVAVAPRGCGPGLLAEALLRRRSDVPVLFVYNDGDPLQNERLAGFAWRLHGQPPRREAPVRGL